MLRNRALALTAVASTALALTACGSDSLSSGSGSGSSSSSTTAASGGVDQALAAKLPAKVKAAGVIKVGTDATASPDAATDGAAHDLTDPGGDADHAGHAGHDRGPGDHVGHHHAGRSRRR